MPRLEVHPRSGLRSESAGLDIRFRLAFGCQAVCAAREVAPAEPVP